jgi:hypothetical protein
MSNPTTSERLDRLEAITERNALAIAALRELVESNVRSIKMNADTVAVLLDRQDIQRDTVAMLGKQLTDFRDEVREQHSIMVELLQSLKKGPADGSDE